MKSIGEPTLALATAGDNFGFDDEDSAQEIVSVKCPKGAKGYYTVIKNVRKTHQIQASCLSFKVKFCIYSLSIANARCLMSNKLS